MRTLGMLMAAGLLFASSQVRADDHPEMRAAERDLQSARAHLQAASHDYGGHRRAAIEHVGKALGEIHDGLASVGGKEKNVEHKEQRLEKRLQGLEQRDEHMKGD